MNTKPTLCSYMRRGNSGAYPCHLIACEDPTNGWRTRAINSLVKRHVRRLGFVQDIV